jgi:uncharacterized protein
LFFSSGADALQFARLPLDPPSVLIQARGEIFPGDADRLAAFLQSLSANDRVTGFVVDSLGGNVSEALKIADFINKSGLTVAVPSGGECASACFLLFAAAPHRFAGANAQIGVHRANEEGQDDWNSMATTTYVGQVLSQYGVPPAIIGRMVQTAPSSMEWLTPTDLASMGVLPQANALPAHSVPQERPVALVPSFDCAAASAPAEFAICSDAALADLDNQLARQFSARLAATPAASTRAFRMEQLHWLRDRNACGSDRDCLARSYQARLQQLAQASVDTGGDQGPSFNCSAASAPAEIAICSDTQLSYLDNQLSQQYSARIMSTPSAAAKAIKTAQVRWLKTRNSCGADRVCIANSYQTRIEQLAQ